MGRIPRRLDICRENKLATTPGTPRTWGWSRAVTESRRMTVGLVRGEVRIVRRKARRVAHCWRLTPVFQQWQIVGLFQTRRAGRKCLVFNHSCPLGPRGCLNVNIWWSDILPLQPLDCGPPWGKKREIWGLEKKRLALGRTERRKERQTDLMESSMMRAAKKICVKKINV